MTTNADLLALALASCPISRTSLTAAASASTTAQGQFSTIDASTPILAASTGAVALNVIVNPSPFAAVSADGLVDDNGLLLIMVDQGTNGQTVNSITVTTGTLAFQFVGTRYGLFAVLPGNDARVTAAIALSAGNANTRVTMLNRTFNASNVISTV